MVPLPKRRHSTRRGGKRRAALSVKIARVMKCPNCGNPKLPHRVCPSCGFYSGKQVVKAKSETHTKHEHK